jgi:hypothetical protein
MTDQPQAPTTEELTARVEKIENLVLALGQAELVPFDVPVVAAAPPFEKKKDDEEAGEDKPDDAMLSEEPVLAPADDLSVASHIPEFELAGSVNPNFLHS